jgi:hypothetical protein
MAARQPNAAKLALALALTGAVAVGMAAVGRPSAALPVPLFLRSYELRRPLPLRGHHVFPIVYSAPQGLPNGTFAVLHALSASGVFLYSAWYSDAYFPVPRNPYGFASMGNSVWTSVEALHKARYVTIAVISSALFDTEHAPKAQRALVQTSASRYGIFDPLHARRFIDRLVGSLVRHAPVDALYVGEPYYINGAQDRGNRSVAFPELYRTVGRTAAQARIGQVMIVPYSVHQYTSGKGLDPIHVRLLQMPFRMVGVDAEFADTSSNPRYDLGYLWQMALTARMYAGRRPTLIELSLKNATRTAFVPPALFTSELALLQRAHISDVVLFAAEYFRKAPRADRRAYAAALRAFAAGRPVRPGLRLPPEPHLSPAPRSTV